MLDNISLILISSSKLLTNEMDDQSLLIDADGTLRVARSPLAVHSHMTRSVSATRWHRGCGGSPAPSALNATLIRTASWTTRSPSQVELDPKSSLPPLVGHAEPVVPYLISAYWTNLDHVIIQSTEEDVDRGKFANIPLQLHIKVLAIDRVLENANVKWGIKRYVQNRQRA